MHALEICYMTGKPYSSFRSGKKRERPFNIIKIGLQREREELYERINRRVDIMIEQGIIEEAKRFYHLREHNSLNTVGYKEIFKVLDGEWELPFAIEKIKQNTRIYSRKQMTWYRRDEEVTWFHPSEIEKILEHIDSRLL
jgi:tRNA dimethylallyltransferase